MENLQGFRRSAADRFAMHKQLKSEILQGLYDREADSRQAPCDEEDCAGPGPGPLCGCGAAWVCESTVAITARVSAPVDSLRIALALTRCRLPHPKVLTLEQCAAEVAHAVSGGT
jgi:hypothetical protein